MNDLEISFVRESFFSQKYLDKFLSNPTHPSIYEGKCGNPELELIGYTIVNHAEYLFIVCYNLRVLT